MQPTFEPSQPIEQQAYSSALHTSAENIMLTDWEDVGDDDANRHARLNNSATQGRTIVTGTDVSHELVYLVNDHPLLPLDTSVVDDSIGKLATGTEEEHHKAQQDDRPAPLAAATTNPVNNAKAAPDATASEHDVDQHDKPNVQPKTAPVLHASASLDVHVDHQPAPSADQLHHANSVHLHSDPAHTNAIPETFKGASQHDAHLSDLIANDTLPPVNNASGLDTASQPSPLGYAMPAASELLIPAEELLISSSSSDELAPASATPLELTDLLGGEPPASWNTHQPAMDEGVIHVMPEYLPVELEQTDLHHLY